MAGEPEHGKGEQADVHAGDHQQVIDASLLEFFADVAQQQRVITDHHGGKDRGVFMIPGTLGAGDVRENAAADGVAKAG